MLTDSIVSIQSALDAAKVRFIVVGGLAVIAHGYLRMTRDADVVIELVPNNIEKAFKTLASIGYYPKVPITAEQFSNAELRKQWNEEKGMKVLQFWSDRHRETTLDVFIYNPFDFEAEWDKTLQQKLAPEAAPIRFASIPSLIAMKTLANRPQDKTDIHYLTKILESMQNE
jgi:hypothetical protein